MSLLNKNYFVISINELNKLNWCSACVVRASSSPVLGESFRFGFEAVSMNYANLPLSTKNMWRVIFFERVGPRVVVDRSGPWFESKDRANEWAAWFDYLGYCVALQSQQGDIERHFAGLPL